VDPRQAELERRLNALLETQPPATTAPPEFLGAQFDAGLAYVHFPEGCGGLGMPVAFQSSVDRRLFAAGAPSAFRRNPIGYGMAGPTIMTEGSEAQKQRYLRPMFCGEHVWCQLFSEPGAGSDLASLSTRAERDGDEWVVNGQKVWTSLAHVARYGLLLTRTDPNVPKHQELTYFVVDMHAPGVEVRPLRQITGEAEFNEVFLEDVRIADDERLGPVGGGWRAALSTLMFERLNGDNDLPQGGGAIATALQEWSKYGDDSTPSGRVLRDRLAACWIAAEVRRLTTLRASAQRDRGVPGPDGSVAKLGMATVNQAVFDLAVDLSGAEGMLYPAGYELRRPETMGFDGASDATRSFLRAQANSIEGGTSDIMRNILAERVLGLPGEVRVDKHQPWKDVARS
jgi:alkylation response protein AidB-like acyl-CoA dehydrogenase